MKGFVAKKNKLMFPALSINSRFAGYFSEQQIAAHNELEQQQFEF